LSCDQGSIAQPLNEIFLFFEILFFLCYRKIKTVLPSQKIKLAANHLKNKKRFRRHIGLSHHFDFLAWQYRIYL
jgi:hypothetical protein